MRQGSWMRRRTPCAGRGTSWRTQRAERPRRKARRRSRRLRRGKPRRSQACRGGGQSPRCRRDQGRQGPGGFGRADCHSQCRCRGGPSRRRSQASNEALGAVVHFHQQQDGPALRPAGDRAPFRHAHRHPRSRQAIGHPPLYRHGRGRRWRFAALGEPDAAGGSRGSHTAPFQPARASCIRRGARRSRASFPETASGALDRIEIPADATQRISELVWTGATVIISDVAMSDGRYPMDFQILQQTIIREWD